MIGRDGVGKTELVYELADQLIRPTARVPKSLWYQQVFMLDASRILSAAGQRGELEALVSTLLGEAYAAKTLLSVSIMQNYSSKKGLVLLTLRPSCYQLLKRDVFV